MRIRHWTALICLSLAWVAPVVCAQATTRIAVVHSFEVIQQMAEWKDQQTKYKTETDQLNAAMQKKKDDLLAMAAQRKQYNPSHPIYNEISAKIDQATIEADAWQQNVTRQGDREKKLALRDIFRHFQEAAAKVAKAQQIDLVLNESEEELPDVESVDYQGLMMHVALHSVIYSSKALDIDNAVLTQADADYAAGKRNSSAAVAPLTHENDAKSQPPTLDSGHLILH